MDAFNELFDILYSTGMTENEIAKLLARFYDETKQTLEDNPSELIH